MTAYESLFGELNAAGVRYVVVGGLAVVLHGVARLTADIDLVVDLDPARAANAVSTLERLGLHPRAPVAAEDFADPDKRAAWIRDKGMRVFTMYDPDDPLRTVDLFVESPLPFEEIWRRSVEISLSESVVRVVSLPDLIRLKQLAGRPQDLEDVAALRSLGGEPDGP